jgi:hypothetical protein
MSDDAYGATIAKRRLSRLLAEFRKPAGYTANQVCDTLNWGRGKVGRFEANQWKRPEMSDIRDLIRIYQIAGTDRAEIERLAARCRVRPWWRECGEIFDNEFPGDENDATSIRAVAVRDSKRPAADGLVVDRAVFATFLAEVRRGPLRPRKARDAPRRPQTPRDAPRQPCHLRYMT